MQKKRISKFKKPPRKEIKKMEKEKNVKKDYQSLWYRTYQDFLECQEMIELVRTDQIGMAAQFFLTVLVLHTLNTDGILFKYSDDGKIVPLTYKDISNWFILFGNYTEETIAMYINLLTIKKLLYTNKFGCLTITNYCYSDENEPALHSVRDPLHKSKVYGAFDSNKNKRFKPWREKYGKLLKEAGQENPLLITTKIDEYMTLADLTKMLKIAKSSMTRYAKVFSEENENAIFMLDGRTKAIYKKYINQFIERFGIETK